MEKSKKKTKKSTPTTNNKAKSAAKSEGQDVIKLLLEDHKPLKQLMKIMKDSEKYNLDQRQEAFEEFAPLLLIHAKPEEQTVYAFMKEDEELRQDGFEGDVEHMLADQLVEEINRTEDQDLWSARVKVLAEMVEHHIEEEEDEMFSDLKKQSELEDRILLGKEYLVLKDKLIAVGGKDSASEVNEEVIQQH